MTPAARLIAIVGPTGAGKSDLALQIAEHIVQVGGKAEIVNSDSMQFYRGMNIGTAKLGLDERKGIRHHLIDWLDITDESTAAEFQNEARPLIQSLQSQGIVPILVGGSMLYVAAVLNLFEFPARDETLRAQLEQDLVDVGPHELHRRLQSIDPIAASRIIPENGRRTVRALEIVTLTGQPFAAEIPEDIKDWQPVLEIGINGPRDDLRERLATRVARMWHQGLVAEVRALEAEGIRKGKTSSRAIGYAQALAQIDGEMTEAEAIADTVRLTQKYARRQMSWFRRDKRIQWLDYQDLEAPQKALALVDEWLGV
jgi:tRNA dimethylallyltransferase